MKASELIKILEKNPEAIVVVYDRDGEFQDIKAIDIDGDRIDIEI